MIEKEKPYVTFGSLVRRAAKLLTQRLAINFKEMGLDLTAGHWFILTALWVKEGRNQNELANFCNMDKTNITKLLDAMEKLNLVVKIEDRQDRRNKLVYLTNKGKELREEMTAAQQKTLNEAQEGVNPSEVAICQKVLKKVIGNLR
ncbi:MarR family winged helix-turn-helix transcriptional regulator [Xanthovirga aplysinae]|uniref:MarR family winged helix-turn-helix transcriptional regulator n=1 Tax=Xanthovirga aplysinae TaxID=2529853 RepID=UPI0012BB8E88|nr:MarR family transcriptional regulator [Xanthovirga aplysinae]MTI32182.1 MarR family transcriptional regulator [Xanthovirga aplysinae]